MQGHLSFLHGAKLMRLDWGRPEFDLNRIQILLLKFKFSLGVVDFYGLLKIEYLIRVIFLFQSIAIKAWLLKWKMLAFLSSKSNNRSLVIFLGLCFI